MAGEGNWIQRFLAAWKALALLVAVLVGSVWMLWDSYPIAGLTIVIVGSHIVVSSILELGNKASVDPLLVVVVFTVASGFPQVALDLLPAWNLGVFGWLFLWLLVSVGAGLIWYWGPGKTLAVRRANAWLLGREMPVA